MVAVGLIVVAVVAYCLAHFGYNTMMESRFAEKQYWAVCIENQGMATSEMHLYIDSTFYARVLNEPIWGTYQMQESMLHLDIASGNPSAFCDFYRLDDTLPDGSTKLMPIGNCGVDFMLLYVNSGKGIPL